MRRLIAVAAFVLALASVCVQAQRGGGHGFSGGHGGVASHGSMGGHAGGSHAFSGMRTSPRFNGSTSGAFRPNSSFRQHSFNRPGFNSGVRFRSFNARNCFGCRRGFISPWGYGGYYDPYWWWDSGSSYDYEQEQQIGLANEMNQQNLAEQQMRHEQEQNQNQDQDVYARPRSSDRGYAGPPVPMRGDVQAQSFAPTTVLVFRDQHQQEVQNYAIVGDVLWAFSPQRQKIQLDDLDIAATQKTNDERGVDFRIPNDAPTNSGRLSIGISYQ